MWTTDQIETCQANSEASVHFNPKQGRVVKSTNATTRMSFDKI